ncbi:4-amino-4-deoxychorismate lyase [Pseudomonas sp. ATCC 13867]|uniref:aminodeoxychorismate lyase n=1 Tax=Pseudomonas sp. ATCC 13867 TaxID=1294143 RepID=UPI0002C4E185|nr:aminodeoxychorismate lyase [Pseudomonas sp. ATCC 13867]AGI25074.1 4-amino-4-deoxychorismate lyase [Pseudomonas sp. ATCC 13867]RFQ38672.1 aminodeoxychorismate lyase [Pseudomonas sp. ATCC 13867]
MLSWVDGRSAEALSVRDRGLAYGDGLFETISVSAGRPRLLARHMARLEEGVERLSLPVSLDRVENELLRFCTALGDGVAKLMLTRGEGARGYAPQVDAQVRRLLLGSPAPAYPARHREEGVQLFPCVTRLAEQPLLAGLKHLNRLEQVLARAEWNDPAFAEGLMRDVSGRIIEGVFSNLFLVRDGQLITADLCRCGVAGVMRAEVIERAGDLGLPVIVRDIDFAELARADEVFLCNSLYGIWPVRGMDGHAWPVGSLTRKLQGQLRELLDS